MITWISKDLSINNAYPLGWINRRGERKRSMRASTGLHRATSLENRKRHVQRVVAPVCILSAREQKEVQG